MGLLHELLSRIVQRCWFVSVEIVLHQNDLLGGLEKFAEAKPLWAEAQAAFEGEVGRDRAIRLRDEILELNLGG